MWKQQISLDYVYYSDAIRKKFNINCQCSPHRRKAATGPMTTGVKQNCAVTWTAWLQSFHKHKFPTLRSYLPESNNRLEPDSKLFFPAPTYTQIGIIWTIWSPFRNEFFDGVWEKSDSEGWETRTKEPRKHSAVQFPTLRPLIVSSLMRNQERERERERMRQREEEYKNWKQTSQEFGSSSKPRSNFLTYCKCLLAPSKTSFFLTHK